MKRKPKELLATIAISILMIVIFVFTIFVSDFIMRAGVAIESEMPSMQENSSGFENCSVIDFQD